MAAPDRTFDSASDVRRYSDGYERGLQESGSWHPYMGFDTIWAMGYRDAHEDFPPKQ